MKRSLCKAAVNVVLLLMSLALIEQGVAQPGQAGKGGKGRGIPDDGRGSISLTVELARDLALSVGLTGQQSLPPGIARNLARGKPIPPGLRSRRVSGDMLAELSRYSGAYGDGYEWRIAGEDLLLIELGSLVVREVFRGVFQ